MQRKFLEDLGLEKDAIDKIMAENGNDINSTKQKLEAERDNYKSQLDTAQESLKGFDGVDVKEMQGKITQLQGDLKAKETEYQNKLADMEFSSVLDAAVSASGTVSAKALKAFLADDMATLKASKNQAEDIKAAIERVKADDANKFMFKSDEPFQNPVGQTGGYKAGAITPEAFAKMGYMQRNQVFNENPELYKQLAGKNEK